MDDLDEPEGSPWVSIVKAIGIVLLAIFALIGAAFVFFFIVCLVSYRVPMH